MAKSLDTPHLNDVIYKYMHNKIYRVLFCSSLSLIGITIVTGSLLSNIVPSVTAESSSTATATVNVSSSCSLSATVDAEHTATLLNGIYSGSGNYPNGIGSTTIKAVCNDNAGFAIYAVGFSGDTYGDNTMIGTSGATIPTGTATSGANSEWAMKLAKVTDATAYNPANLTITNNYDSYHNVPNDYEKVASFSSATDQTLGSKLTATYAAYISNTQAADTYTGKVKYTMVHPASALPETPAQPVACAGGKICYSPGPSSVTDSMGNQTVWSGDTEAMLWASNFKREGYGFAGWTDKPDWVLGANDASGNGTGANTGYHIYGPNQTIEFTAGQYSTAGLPLYAVWVKSAGSIQNWSGCSSLAQGAVTALTDQRDNNTYAVAKLADGNCWMIENLRLDNTNSDNATGALAQGYGSSQTYGNFIGLANPETANFKATGGENATSPTEPNSIYYAGTLVAPATVNISQTNYASYRMPRFQNGNTSATVANMTGMGQNVYSYGNYYTWSAAKANTDYLNTIENSNAANTSICPKGWRLPKGGDKANESTNDFWSLIVTGINNGTNPAGYSSNQLFYSGYEEAGLVGKKLRTFPNNFVYSGIVGDSSVTNRGWRGYYWSATASSYNNAYIFEFYSTIVRPGTTVGNKYSGSSVRCVLSPSS